MSVGILTYKEALTELETLMDLIKEAFEAYGNGYNSTYVRKVEIKIISEPYFIPYVE